MGFLKTIRTLILLISFLFAGCSASLIRVKLLHNGKNEYLMFGKTPSREFYNPVVVGDSLKQIWESEIHGGFNNSSVTINDKYVFVNDVSGRIFCFNINNGKEEGQLKYTGTVYSSPIINKNLVLIAVAKNDENYSELNIYDYRDGSKVAEKKVKGRVLTQMIKTDKAVVFNTDDGHVYKYSFIGGKLWEIDTKISTHSSPALANGIVIFGNDSGQIVAINYENGKIIYKKKINQSIYGGFAISNSAAFFGDNSGNFYSCNLKTGKINWKIQTGAKILMTPVIIGDKIIIGNLEGDLFSVNIHNCKKLWENKLEGVLNASPYASKNLLFVPNLNGDLFLINQNDGTINKKIVLPSHAKLSPVLFNNKLFVGFDDGVLRAYEIQN